MAKEKICKRGRGGACGSLKGLSLVWGCPQNLKTKQIFTEKREDGEGWGGRRAKAKICVGVCVCRMRGTCRFVVFRLTWNSREKFIQAAIECLNVWGEAKSVRVWLREEFVLSCTVFNLSFCEGAPFV